MLLTKRIERDAVTGGQLKIGYAVRRFYNNTSCGCGLRARMKKRTEDRRTVEQTDVWGWRGRIRERRRRRRAKRRKSPQQCLCDCMCHVCVCEHGTVV